MSILTFTGSPQGSNLTISDDYFPCHQCLKYVKSKNEDEFARSKNEFIDS